MAKRPTEAQMVSKVEDKITALSSKGKFPTGGQYVVFVQDIWFPTLRLNMEDAGRIVRKAAVNLGLDPSALRLGF